MNMHKYTRFFASLIIPSIGIFHFGIAQAAWTIIGRTDVFRVYLDDKQMRRNGDFAQIAQLTDYAVAQWVDARTAVGSIKHLIEFDCKQHVFRLLSATAYSEQMEAGSLVASEKLTDPEWMSIEPGSTAEKVEQVACGKE